MPKFSKTSLERLSSCDIRLQNLFHEIIKYQDCTIIEGYRGKEVQNHFFAKGTSKLKWPDSNHNKYPSRAVDVIAYPIQWENGLRNAMFAGLVLGIAFKMGIPIRAGIDWNQNFDPTDNWNDVPHFELID